MTDSLNVKYRESTHAPLLERYMGPDEGHVKVGEPEHESVDGPRIDSETGAEYRALGGKDHRYSTEYKIGASYPKNVFITATGGEGESLTHDELEAALRERDLWREDHLRSVLLPKGYEYGTPTWYYGFMFTPVERAPRMDRVEDQLTRRAQHRDLVYATGPVVEATI